jgi:hypothetical protein
MFAEGACCRLASSQSLSDLEYIGRRGNLTSELDVAGEEGKRGG